jgi:hypothetical protein
MRELITSWILILALLASAMAAPAYAVSDTDLAVFVNAQSRIVQMSAVEMETLFTRTQTRWDDGSPIVPLNMPPGSQTRIVFDRVVLRLDPDDVGRFWIDRRIRGLGLPPRQVGEPATIVRVVEKLNGAIGYAPEAMIAGAQVRVVARIRNGKVVAP